MHKTIFQFIKLVKNLGIYNKEQLNKNTYNFEGLHECCKKLGIDIECWGICMGDCTKTEIDPIFYMTECGDFMVDVTKECCKDTNITARDFRKFICSLTIKL